MTGVAVKHAVFTGRQRAYIAKTVKDRERITVLEDAPRLLASRRNIEYRMASLRQTPRSSFVTSSDAGSIGISPGHRQGGRFGRRQDGLDGRR